MSLFVGCLLGSTSALHAGTWVLNNPYPKSDANKKIYYSSFSEQPKTLDPARSYSSNEYLFIGQIYEPLLEYDYLIRPYQLVPLTTTSMPEVRYLDAENRPIVVSDGVNPAYTVYTLHIKRGVFYQPHPALAKDVQGQYLYHHLPEDYLEEHDISKLSDFEHTGTRELTSDDYIYQIKRLGNPVVGSPILGLIGDYIIGLANYGSSLPKSALANKKYIDLRQYPLAGVKKIDDYTFEITIKGHYSQFLFWLAMPFFAPIPWEADLFYSQQGMDDKNLSFDWYPIGTGPFLLKENNPNRQMVLEKNPNYRQVFFPATKDQGELLPLIDRAVYTLEKESIPRWNKFLQGYYDASGISSDSFDKAIHINRFGEAVLTQEMHDKKIHLAQALQPTISYIGFNMLDPIVGGVGERARKLRLAISIAVNYEEYIAIFFNGRGRAAQGPIPPGIFGYTEGITGINPYVYQVVNNEVRRRSIADAKKLMTQAGYPGGIDPKTGRALILNYDVATTGSPEDKSIFDWMRKQYASIGIDLNIRTTLYNRFQEKMRTGNAQIFSWGWNADYPDPENFLFQLYGRNAKVRYGGENAANYVNPEFDRLYDLMKNRGNDVQRQELVDSMLELVRHDAPWIWGMHTEDFMLTQDWVSNLRINSIYLSTLKYVALDVTERNKLRIEWNQPILWPLGLLFGLVLALTIPLVWAYFKKEKQSAIRMDLR
jgi:ABC-type transport system substrate-binding protein